MKLKTYLLCLTLVACTNGQQDSNSLASKTPDSTDSGINLKQIRQDFLSTYSKPITIDTTFYWHDTLYKAVFTHFSTMDSDLTVPAKYNFDINKDFVTHNFKSQLVIIKDADTLLTRDITKQTFKEYLTPELACCSTLLFPTLYIQGDTIELGYNLAIPVTDVGIRVAVKFDTKGFSHTSN